MILSTDLWHCQNMSFLHHNKNYTFPNIILPVLDQSLSALGAMINTFLILTIYIRGKRSGSINMSSLFLINICLINLVECANCILIYKSNEDDHNRSGQNINYYLSIASEVQKVTNFVRLTFMLTIYLIRLLYISSPSSLLSLCGERGRFRGKVYCITIWTLGIVIGGFGIYARTVKAMDLDYVDARIQHISLYLQIVNEILHVAGLTVSLTTIIYLALLFSKYQFKNNIVSNLDATDSRDHGVPKVKEKNLIHCSVKSALGTLLHFYLVDLILSCYPTLLSVTLMKTQFTPGCYPAVFVLIRNYLGTNTNLIYSYHCLGVLYGISVCLIFLFQNAMGQTVKYMWESGGLLALEVVERLRQGRRNSAYSKYYV